jgi:Na+/melibiose symporter-like transporter
MSAAGTLGMYLFSAVTDVYPLFLACGFMGMMGVGCSFVAQTIMLSDIVDYGARKLGYRSDSVVFSMKGFLQKGAYSLQSVIMYAGLQLTGYRGELAAQPAGALTAITVMMFLLPPALTLMALWVFSKKYKLDEERMREING